MNPTEREVLLKLAKENGILPMGDPEDLAVMLNSQRPKINLPGDNRELGQFAREVGEILCTRDLFRRDLTPVNVNHEKQRLDPMTPEKLRTWAEIHLVCFKEKQIAEGGGSARVIQIVKTMNLDSAKGVIASIQFQSQLPEIERVNPTRLPVMRTDGRIELVPNGYFAERKIYTIPDGLEYDEEMTLDQAKEVFADLLHDFPFKDGNGGRSMAVAIAACLTMFGAGLLPQRALRPAFIYTANSPGAGKTLLAKVAIIAVTGSASPRSFPRHEEMKKILDVIAMDANTYVLFDNIKGQVGGEEIEAFITAPEWEGRILGESTKFRVDNTCTVFLTGNDSRTTQDMEERSLVVELFVQEADNRDRKIPRVIDDTFLGAPACRGKMCSAMWAMVKAWDGAGRPPAPTRLPRFEAWSDVIAAVTAFAGYGDPCRKREVVAGGGDVAEMRNLVDKLKPEPPVTVEDWNFAMIMDEVEKHGLFENVSLEHKKGEPADMYSEEGGLTPAARSFFGKFLARFNGRLFVGDGGEPLRFIVQGKGNQRKFYVENEAVKPVGAVS